MNRHLGRTAACLAAGALVATTLAAGTATAAIPTNAVLFGQANIHGYATGTEAHAAALTVGTTKVADVEQAFSGASTASAGLTTPLSNELGLVVQPAEPGSVHAFGTGDGLEVGLATPTTAQTDANQILLGGKAESIAPPNSAPVFKNLLSIGTGTTAALGALIKANVLNGEGASIYDPAQCPIGQPISFGAGNAAGVSVLPLPGTPGLVGTTGTGTAVAQTASETYLSPNGDSTWGLSSSVATDIAPASVNLGSTASIQVSVATNKGVNTPVTLTATTTGESGKGGSVTVSNDDVVTVALVTNAATMNLVQVPLGNLTAANNGVVDIPLDLADLGTTVGEALDVLSGLASSLPGGSALVPLISTISTTAGTLLGGLKAPLSDLTNLIDLNLGSIDIESLPHAIGASPTTKPSPSGTSASGAIDLVKATVGLTLTGTLGKAIPAPLNGLSIANVAVGHMEASANTAAPITCSIPVTKVADPPSVTAGNAFTYTIDVPDPAKLGFIDCSLSNLDVTDVISDVPGQVGDPTFQINSVLVEQKDAQGNLKTISVPGTVTPGLNTTTTSATVAWKSTAANPLTYTLGDNPLMFVINLSVPKDSPAGIIQDTATAVATLTGCSGGAAGSTSASATAANGQPLTGSVTLQKPSVAALTVTTPGGATTTVAKTLPFTGAIGGPWQPIAGVAALGLAGGAFALVRRSRRRRPIS